MKCPCVDCQCGENCECKPGQPGCDPCGAFQRQKAATAVAVADPRSLPGGQRTIGPVFLTEEETRGLLFDCDGTLIDTMPLFFHSWVETCAQFDLQINEAQFYGFAGMSLPDIVRELHRQGRGGAEADAAFIDEFLAAKKLSAQRIEETHGAPPAIECVVRIAREAVARGFPVAIATSGLREHVEAHLADAGLSDLFSVEKGNIVFAKDVPQGKPAPDIFLAAAARIGVAATSCRAYEDGEHGLLSAYSAGCHVIDVTCMHQYPATQALRASKRRAEAERSWLPA